HDYLNTLRRDAIYLSRFGDPVTDVSRLYSFEVQKAIGLDPLGVVAAATDDAAPSGALPLSFGRWFGNTITSRYHLGPFGRGWEAAWQQFVDVQSDGTLVVHESTDDLRVFQPDGRHAGTYLSQIGDPGVMKAVGGGYELTETDGTKTRFRSDGKLEYLQ